METGGSWSLSARDVSKSTTPEGDVVCASPQLPDKSIGHNQILFDVSDKMTDASVIAEAIEIVN